MLLLLAQPPPAPCSERCLPQGKKKKKVDNYRRPIVWEPAAELRQEEDPISGLLASLQWLWGTTLVSPPCDAPFKGRDSRSAVTPGLPASSHSRQKAGRMLSTGPCPLTSSVSFPQKPMIVPSGGHWWGFGRDLKTQELEVLRHTGARPSEAQTVSRLLRAGLDSKVQGWVNWIKGGGGLVLHWNSQWKIKIHTFPLTLFTNHRHCRHIR